jgi:hypothetical protein
VGGGGEFVDGEAEEFGPFFGFFEGLDGLAFTGGDDEPGGFRMAQAIENGFSGAGEVLAGLAGPEADFEAGRVRCKSGLVGQKTENCGMRIADCGLRNS